MNTDTASTLEASDAVEAPQDEAPAAHSPEQYAIIVTAQNLALSEALANLTAAIRAGQDAAPLLVLADQAIAGSMRNPNGSPDFTVLANVLGGHAGWRIVNEANRAFEQALREDLASKLPTIAILDVAEDMQDGDDGSSYPSFEGVDVTFKDGTKLWIPQDYDGDGDEFSLADGEQLLRNEAEDLDESDQAEQAELVAKYAALFGVEPNREALITCLDTISAYLESYYWHNARQGGSDRVYEA